MPISDVERQQQIAKNREDSKPIIDDLAQIGIYVEWVSDLIYKYPSKYQTNHREIIPILLRWLPLIENPDIKGDIVGALSVPWAKGVAARPLIEEFRKAQEGRSLKWAIGNALSVVADKSVFDELVELVRDKRHGKAREMLPLALVKTKDPRVVSILIELLDDEEIAGHAVSALRRLAPPEARTAIEPFISHPKTWIRNEAKRALAKIDKKLARKPKA
jgi:hypothetical protein